MIKGGDGVVNSFCVPLFQDANLSEPQKQFTKTDIEALEMFYYSTDIHRAAFALPPFIEKELYK